MKRSKKKLLLQKINFEPKLEKLVSDLESLPAQCDEVITGRHKSTRRVDESYRRSNFIGVSKNGPSWQALIAINKRKTYIGTYDNENAAAKAFDFYSLLLHSLTAKTNFSYKKKEILEMIEKFKDPENKKNNF